jgi:DNA-binding transcriptional MocR family regulator
MQVIEICCHMGYKTSMPKSLLTAQINIPPGFVDLGRGDPQLALLPLHLLRQAADRRFSQGDNSFLQYGTEQGDGSLRAALADFLGDGNGSSADPDTLFITAGISSALDLLCTVFTRWGDTVFVEEPSYFLALRIFADHGLHVVSISTDGSGLVIEALEDALREHRAKFLYVIPTFQNPSGHTLTQERRERLLSLSRQHNFLLLADEVYQYLNYTVQPPKPFGAYREFENVISLGSFSKILAPGLRLGWMQADARIIQRLTGCGLLTSGGGMNPFTSAVVCGLIESGDLKKNIANLVRVYSARVRAMDESLRRHLPDAEFTTPQGGYFFWVRLPGGDTETLRKEAQPLQVDFRPGILFSSQGGLRDYLRLSISYYEAEDIELGLRRLEQSLRR